MSFRAEVQPVNAVRRRDAARIEKFGAGGARNGLVVRGELPGFLDAVLKYRRRKPLGIAHRRRRDDEDLRRGVFAPGSAILRPDKIDELSNPLGNLFGRSVECRFQVIGAEHDDHELERQVRGHGRGQVRAAVEASAGQLRHGRTARSVVRPFKASSTTS